MEGSQRRCLCEIDVGRGISAKSAGSWVNGSQSQKMEDLSPPMAGDIHSTGYQNEPTSSQDTVTYTEEVEEDEETVITGSMLPSPHSTGSSCSDSVADSENRFDEDIEIDEIRLSKKGSIDIHGFARGLKAKKGYHVEDNHEKYDGDLSQVPSKRLMVNSSGSLLVLSEMETCNACPDCDDICDLRSCRSCMDKIVGLLGNDDPHQRKRKSHFSPCEILRHRTLGSCWIVANNDVYDVTDFLTEHPAGAIAIARYGGGIKNCHEDMMFHSRRSQSMWKKMKIGTVTKCRGGFPIFSEFDNKAFAEFHYKERSIKNRDYTSSSSEVLIHPMQPNHFHDVEKIPYGENICTIM